MSKRLHFVRQHDLMDCGVAAFFAVCKYFNVPTNYNWIRSNLYLTNDGATLADIAEVSKKLCLNFDPIEIEDFNDLYGIDGIFLLCSKSNSIQNGYGHFVVLRFLSKSKCEIADPANGVYTIDVSVIQNRFEKIGLLFINEENSIPKTWNTEIKLESSELINFLKKFKNKFLVLCVFSILISLINVAQPLLFGKIIDTLSSPDKKGLLLFLASYIICTTAYRILGLSKEYYFFKKSQNFSFKLSSVLVRRILNLNWNSYASRRFSDYVTRFNSIQSFKSLAVEAINSLLGRTTLLLMSATTLYLINQKLLFISIFAGILLLVINLVSLRKRSNLSYKINIHSAGSCSNFYELMNLKKWSNINGANSFFFKRWSKHSKSILKINALLTKYDTKLNLMVLFTSSFIEFFSFLITIKLLNDNLITVGNLVTAVGLQNTIMDIVSSYDSIKLSSNEAKLSFDRLQDIFIETQSESHNRPSNFKNDNVLKINLNNVSFSYLNNQENSILKNINMELLTGEITLIKGPSGSGKSSLLGVLAGMYMPRSGNFLINDNININFENIQQLKLMSYVDQELKFLEGSILENLTLGKSVNIIELNEMIDSAGLSDEIAKFPRGLNSEIMEASKGFSGGQMQRLSVIRALISDKPIVLMDEPTSSLDFDSEQKICYLIQKYKKNKLIVVASHSDYFLEISDKVFVINKGVIT
jgi:ATP-binding cassette subfamily B protein